MQDESGEKVNQTDNNEIPVVAVAIAFIIFALLVLAAWYYGFFILQKVEFSLEEKREILQLLRENTSQEDVVTLSEKQEALEALTVSDSDSDFFSNSNGSPAAIDESEKLRILQLLQGQ